MRKVKLRDLSGVTDIQISSFLMMKQVWREGHTFVMRNPRRQSAFLWFCGSAGSYRMADGTALFAPKGSFVYIPEGSVYTLTFTDCTEEISTVLIELCLSAEGEPFVLSSTVRLLEEAPIDPAVIEVVTRMADAYLMPERPNLALMSDLYRLLSLLASASDRRHMKTRGFSTIEAGIRYLQTDEKQALTLDEVAAMCYVTPAYFRRLFRKYAGVSPSEYRAARRIERAKELLRIPSLSVATVSEMLGYESPSYFCRVFKQQAGLSPAAYQKENSIEK